MTTETNAVDREAIADELCGIKMEIETLIDKAMRLVRSAKDNQITSRAEAYWFAHIMAALDSDGPHGNRYDHAMSDTIEELQGNDDDN